MKKAIAVTCCSIGFLGSVLGLVWYLTILLTQRPTWPFPSGIVSIEALFAVWATVMFATFFRSPKPIWTAILTVTSRRVRLARFVLGCAAANMFVCMLVSAGLLLAGFRQPLPWLFCLAAASCALLNGIYVFVHWALRPDSFLSERFRDFVDDPVVFTFMSVFKGTGAGMLGIADEGAINGAHQAEGRWARDSVRLLDVIFVLANAAGVAVYLALASRGWRLPEERGAVPVAGEPFVWALALPVLGVFFLADVIWGVLLLRSKQWEGRLCLLGSAAV